MCFAPLEPFEMSVCNDPMCNGRSVSSNAWFDHTICLLQHVGRSIGNFMHWFVQIFAGCKVRQTNIVWASCHCRSLSCRAAQRKKKIAIFLNSLDCHPECGRQRCNICPPCANQRRQADLTLLNSLVMQHNLR